MSTTVTDDTNLREVYFGEAVRAKARAQALLAALRALEAEMRALAHANQREGVAVRADVWTMAADRLAALRTEHGT